MAWAARNGFYYLLDRNSGEFLFAKNFVRQTWAKGFDDKGRPTVNPESDPTPQGAKACPSVEGATNWFSNAYNPTTGLFYLMALEKCNIYTKADAVWTAGVPRTLSIPTTSRTALPTPRKPYFT